MRSQEPAERAEEAVVKVTEGVYEGVEGAVTAKRSTNNVYDNHAYVSVEQATEAMCVNRPVPSDSNTAEEHHLRVITHQALVNKGFQDSEESVQKVSRENPTTSQEGEPNEAASGSTNGVVFRSQEASKGMEEDTKL